VQGEKIMARPKDKADIILAAAIKTFMEKGFAQSSIQDIANGAGIAKGTIYEYFRTKEELFIQAVKLHTSKHIEQIDNIVLSKNTLIAKLGDLLDLFLGASSEEHFKWMDFVFINELAQLSNESRMVFHLWLDNMRDKSTGKLAEILAQAIREGEIRAIDTESVAGSILSLIMGTNMQMRNKNYSVEQINQEKTKIIDFIMNGIRYR
jgi:AcrR family transcriptional regulator